MRHFQILTQAISVVFILSFNQTENKQVAKSLDDRLSNSTIHSSKLSILITGGQPIIQSRSFYARFWTGSGFCGSAVLNDRFALTSSTCAQQFQNADPQSWRRLEVGDFSRPDLPKTLYMVDRCIRHPNFGEDVFSGEVALIRTRMKMKIDNLSLLPLCETDYYSVDQNDVNIEKSESSDDDNVEAEPYDNTLLQFLGLGVKWMDDQRPIRSIAGRLEHVLFKQWDKIPPGRPENKCDSDLICVKPIIKETDAVGRDYDKGGPLIRLSSGTRDPECILGVACPFNIITAIQYSIFASVPHYHNWIQSAINATRDE